MKCFIIGSVFLGVLLVGAQQVRSAALGSPGSPQRKSLVDQLQAVKEANRKLLERQDQTLQKLGELEKEASQLKFLTKRG
jgi:hypothetical protein